MRPSAIERCLSGLRPTAPLSGARAERALRYPFAWPADPERAHAIEAYGIARPEPLPAGRVAMVTDGQGGSVWCLTVDDPVADDENSLALTTGAEAHVARAWRLATDHLPCLARPDRLAAPPRGCAWRVGCVGDANGSLAHTIDGGSLGVAALWMFVSWLSELPAPTDIVATAVLDDAGRLRRVDDTGLDQKIAAIVNWAPGVRRLLVAAVQVDAARQAVQRADAPLEVVGAEDFEQALHIGFPELEGRLVDRWRSDTRGAATLAADLFDVAVGTRDAALRDWRGFEGTVSLVLRALPDDGTSSTVLARFAQAVARRHQGRGGELDVALDWIDDHEDRTTRARLWAHAVQTKVDADWTSPEVLERARRELLPPRSRSQPDFELLGALGRYHANHGEWDAACEDLEAAIDGFGRLRDLAGMNRALCELLRVHGVRGDVAAVRALLDARARACFDAGEDAFDPSSRGYLALAALRAFAQCRAWDDALAWDARGADFWPEALVHVRVSRLRWLAHVHARQGDEAKATEDRRELEAALATNAAPNDHFALALAWLDDAVFRADSAAADEALERLAETDPVHVARIRALHADGVLEPLPGDLPRDAPAELIFPATVARFFPY